MTNKEEKDELSEFLTIKREPENGLHLFVRIESRLKRRSTQILRVLYSGRGKGVENVLR